MKLHSLQKSFTELSCMSKATHLDSFPRASITKNHKQVALNDTHLSSQSSGGQKLDMRVAARLVSTGGSEGEFVLVVAGNLRFSSGCEFFSLVSASISLCVHVSSYKNTTPWNSSTPTM